MGNIRRKLLLKSLKLFDVVLMVGCFLLAVFFDRHSNTVLSFEQFLSLRIRLVNFVLFSLLVWTWHATFSGFGLYSSRRLLGRKADVFDIVKAGTVGTLLIVTAGAIFRLQLICVPSDYTGYTSSTTQGGHRSKHGSGRYYNCRTRYISRFSNFQ